MARKKLAVLILFTFALFALGIATMPRANETGDVNESAIYPNTKTEATMITITRKESRPTMPGPEEWFTGNVQVDMLDPVHEPGRTSSASVAFRPGARTAWHTHPLGQTLIVTQGFGWVQMENGPIEEIRAGDVVWIPPHVKHWHGASADSAMTHIAYQEALDGSPVTWMKHVSDEEYNGNN